MSDASAAMSIFVKSLWLILFISFADLLTLPSSAPGVGFNLPVEVCSINNKLSDSIRHSVAVHLEAHLANVVTSAHTVHGGLKPVVGREV